MCKKACTRVNAWVSIPCFDCCARTHNDTHFALVPVKADGEKRSQPSHISQHNSSLSRAVRLKSGALALHHNMKTLATWILYNDVIRNNIKSHGNDYFKVIPGITRCCCVFRFGFLCGTTNKTNKGSQYELFKQLHIKFAGNGKDVWLVMLYKYTQKKLKN